MFAFDGDAEVGGRCDFIDFHFCRPGFHDRHDVGVREEIAGFPVFTREHCLAFPCFDFGDAFRGELHAEVVPFSGGRVDVEGVAFDDGFLGLSPGDEVAAELCAEQFVIDESAIECLGVDGDAIECLGFGKIDAEGSGGDAEVAIANDSIHDS